MTPKEKAQELVDKMKWEGEDAGEQAYQDFAKECALIAVEEILKEIKDIDDGSIFIPYEYWNNVVKEIESL